MLCTRKNRGELTMLYALPPSYRRRALVQIDALIAQAEQDLKQHDATRTGTAETRDKLQDEQRRLALLHRSRQFLLSDEFSRIKAGRH
jgi:hypothetical protein